MPTVDLCTVCSISFIHPKSHNTHCGYELTCRYGVHAHAECVVTSVTLVTEHHLVLVVRLLAHRARLALHTLPVVGLDHTHQLLAHVQAGRVA